jgi:signal transduction histidine kinase
LINSLYNDYKDKAQQKGLELIVNAGEVPKIYGSRLYTREILQNFITNAIKYTQHGSINLTANSNGDSVDMSVSDSGIGISAEEQARLFSKFFRSEDSRVRETSGTGLGLYVTAKLAKLISGRLKVISEINKGSTFVLTVPVSLQQVNHSS